MHVDFGRKKLRIGLALTFEHPCASAPHTGADDARRLSIRCPSQCIHRNCWDLDLHVDAIEKRPRNAGSVTLNLIGRTATPTGVMPQVAARTRVHRGDELKL